MRSKHYTNVLVVDVFEVLLIWEKSVYFHELYYISKLLMRIFFLFFFSFISIWIDLMHSELGTTSLDLNYDGSQSPGSGSSLTQQTRNKRMRTSFKHHQLRTMKSYFAINQNPDAKDLKQLSQKTGLSKRVLQVIEQSCNYGAVIGYRALSFDI